MGMPLPLQIVFQNSLSSVIFIWNSNWNYIEKRTKEPNLKRERERVRERLNSHSLVWKKYNKKGCFFQSAATNRTKATYMYIFIHFSLEFSSLPDPLNIQACICFVF